MSGCEAASSRSAGVVGAGRALEEDGAAAAAAVGAAPSARAIELHLHLRSAWPRFEHMHALVQGGPAAAEAADGAADDAAAEASGPLAMALIAGPPSLPANGTFSLSDPVAFKPNNPAWLRAAAQGAATACLPQPCAVLQQFKVRAVLVGTQPGTLNTAPQPGLRTLCVHRTPALKRLCVARWRQAASSGARRASSSSRSTPAPRTSTTARTGPPSSLRRRRRPGFAPGSRNSPSSSKRP